MNLTQEDYENIWLRFKDKTRRWIFEWAAFITIIIGLLVYLNIENYIKSRADAQIQTLINSDAFRKEALASLEGKLIETNKSFSDLIEKNKKAYDELLLRIKKIDALKNYPIKCNPNGFEIIDSDGEIFKLEYGHGLANDRVHNYFKSSFKYPPSVFLTRTNSPSSPLSYGAKKTVNLFTEIINNKFFTVRYDIGSYSLIEFSWIAVGQ